MATRRSGHNLHWRGIAICLSIGLTATLSQTVRAGAATATASGDINTIAGNGTAGYAGDGGPATAAELNSPTGIRGDGDGNLFVADSFNSVVRKVDPFGVITTVAGNGANGFSGDGGAATAAELSDPVAVALDGSGDLFIADNGNFRVRKVDIHGVITTVAGTGGRGFAGGEGVPATEATLGTIGGLAVDPAGDLFIAQPQLGRIRKVDPSGIITRFAGTVPGFSGDGGPALLAKLGAVAGMTIDPGGNLLVADGFPNNIIRKINIATSVITTVAGTPNPEGGPTGDGGPAATATFANTTDVSIDPADNLYIADAEGNFANTADEIRKVDTTGTVSRVAGTGTPGFSGDGGPATSAQLSAPGSVVGLANGRFAIADTANNRIRLVSGSPNLLTLAKVAPSEVAAGDAFSYRILVSDDGTKSSASGVTMTDHLPAGVAFVSAIAGQGSCSQSAGTVTCALGRLAAGASATITIAVTAPFKTAVVVNSATVTANETDPIAADNTASATTYVNGADLAVALAASPNPGANVGAPLTETATVTDLGPTKATSVKFADTVPAGFNLKALSASQGSCTRSGPSIGCNLGTLVSGAGASVTIVVIPTATGPVANTVKVTAAQVDPILINNTATLAITVSGAGCGQVIVRSTTLAKDIGPCAGDGMIIGADKIALNLGGHRIFGLGTGTGFAAEDGHVGIRLPLRSGVTIEGGTVSGFDAGIFINSGLQNLVTGMTVRDNIGRDSTVGPDFPTYGDGILIAHSAFNKIVSNTVAHNGTYDGIGVFGLDSNGNLIEGNTIKDTVTNSGRADGEGVIINVFLESSDPRRGEFISHNNVTNNTITGNAASGISNESNDSAVIASNTVSGNGIGAFPGNGIGLQSGRAAPSITQDVVRQNQVFGNGDDGIEADHTQGNTITGNNTGSNNVNSSGSFNLEDIQFNLDPCTSNTWTANTSTNGTVSTACLVAGGASAEATSSQRSTGMPDVLPQANRTLPPRP